ncbi:hypothetical protein [Kitasatospora sp. NBC_01266]|uniref:hypothetical protein n=1 Tax=Kitasatospora sp. NBC_01266 TaxID=2903572 RepID=UPI002E2F5E19|nr:hypothetical protein [Kitasatospora sp. NBC_01266]
MERSDPTRSLRCFAVAEPQPRLHVRTACALPHDPAVQLAHDAVVLPLLWDFYASRAAPRPLADHGRVVGVDLTMPDLEPQRLWDEAAVLLRTVQHAVSTGAAPADATDRALTRVVAAHTQRSYDLATLATFSGPPVGSAAGAPTRLHADQVAALALAGARQVIADAPGRADRLAASVLLTATHSPTRPAEADEPAVELPVRLPRGAAPPPWVEVASPHAELAYLQIRRAIPPVSTVRALAAALIANQAWVGPYSSVVDHAIRSREAASYLWDCVVDLTRGEFMMLVAPDPRAADRVIAIVRQAHSDGGRVPPEMVDTARRIIRTDLLRRLGSAKRVLAGQFEVQRAGLPVRFTASLLGALREVTHQEVAAALPAVLAEPLAITLVIPSGPGARST